VVGDRTALPDDLHHGALLLALGGERDLGDHRAQQQLAVTVGGGGSVEHCPRVSASVSAPGDLFLGQRLRAAGTDRGELLLRAVHVLELLFPLALQRARHQPVLGLAAVELTACGVGVLAGALELQLGRVNATVVSLCQLFDCLQRGVDCRWRQ